MPHQRTTVRGDARPPAKKVGTLNIAPYWPPRCPYYLTKYIERMGTGIRDMIQRCRDAGLPEPEIRLDSGVWVTTIRRKTPQVTDQDTPQVTPQDKSLSSSILQDIARILGVSTPQVTPQVVEQIISVLNAAESPASGAELQRAARLKDRVYFLKRYLEPLLAEGLIERTIPEKPTSRLQKYRLTDKGRAQLLHLHSHAPYRLHPYRVRIVMLYPCGFCMFVQ